MAEESDTEKDLPASEQKIRKAREEGNIPRSKDWGGGLILVGSLGFIFAMGPDLLHQSEALFRSGLSLERSHAFDDKKMGLQWTALLEDAFMLIAPLLLLVFVVAIAAHLMVGGLNWSTKPLEPNFSKLNPFTGLKNMFSSNGLFELAKALLKTIVLGVIGYALIQQDLGLMLQMAALPLETGMAEMARIAIKDALVLALVYLFLVSLDVPYQLWRYYKGLRMDIEEIKRESKESEGDPHLKGKIKSMQREAARKRMMSAVPKADVVVVNPTHYSVALRYDKTGQGAPTVVAKGIGTLALRIRALGAEHGVPVLEVPPLARALYTHVDLEEEIPASLYAAVAKLLAYVYALGEGQAHLLELPEAKDVPTGMDPLVGAEVG